MPASSEIMTALLLALALAADPPRYLGGVPPHPLDTVGPVDERPSGSACSVDTLRASTRCLFDGRAVAAQGESDRQRQAQDNVALAVALGEALCRERSQALDAEPREQSARYQRCLKQVRAVTKVCSLDGAEALLDAERLFSVRAQRCYVGLAEATQRVSSPEAPASSSTTQTSSVPPEVQRL